MADSSDEEASDPSSMELMKRDTEEQFTSIYDVSEKRRVTLIEAFFVMVGYNIGKISFSSILSFFKKPQILKPRT